MSHFSVGEYLRFWAVCITHVPNGIGTILGIVQLALYFYYKRKSVEDSREPLIRPHA
ncbi:hypothetical protein CCACVL1_16548 [Corchorus capsularis]|uniref:Uncharacterized protein n=1 Tax=Corchorus capsularis TaxID=210143 RepID=A0A1R3HWP3_COCAP|nr:hypothetical protein CCACVL1_16548 [Corchorus capsularis]